MCTFLLFNDLKQSKLWLIYWKKFQMLVLIGLYTTHSCLQIIRLIPRYAVWKAFVLRGYCIVLF